MQSLLEAWIDREQLSEHIQLGARVASITQREDGVDVVTSEGATLRARRVIVATSPQTARRMSYQPPLSAPRQALMEQPMGRTIKCVLFYKSPWWRDSHQRHYTGYAGAESFPVIWVMDYTPPDTECYALMTFTVAEEVDKLEDLSEDAIRDMVTRHVAFLFNDMRALPDGGEYHSMSSFIWNGNEAFVGGGPNTVMSPGLMTGEGAPIRTLNHPEGHVHFVSAEAAMNADESTSPVWQEGPTEEGT